MYYCHPLAAGSSISAAEYTSALQMAAATLLPPLRPMATMAAAICNALIYSAAEMLDPTARGWK